MFIRRNTHIYIHKHKPTGQSGGFRTLMDPLTILNLLSENHLGTGQYD